GADIAPLQLAAVAAYGPLHALAQTDALLQQSRQRSIQRSLQGPWPAAVEGLITQQVREPRMEREIAVPALTAIEDEVSRKVQHQYEAMPYPRWIKAAAAGQPVTLDWYLRSQFPAAPIRATLPQGGLDILIAGCGTGQHAIETAQRFAQARVLA